MARTRSAPALIGLAVLGLSAPGARAFAPMMVPNMMQAVVLNPCQPGTPCGDAAAKTYGISPYKVLPRGGMAEVEARARARARLAGGGAAAAAGRPLDPALTRYTPSPQVSAEVKARFLQELTAKLPPDQAARARQTLGARDLVAVWAQEMAPQGLHPGDVADAVASYWVLNWIMANHADADPGAARAVRDQIRRVIAANGHLGAASNAQKQAMAEMLMMEFVAQSALYKNALLSHNAEVVSHMSEGAEDRFRSEMKIDLRGLTLTPTGFVRKS